MMVLIWDLYHDLTSVHRNTIAEEIDIGYRFSILRRLYLDLRMNEIVSVHTWLSEEHTIGGWATIFGSSLPKSPLLSLDFGIRM